MIKLYTIPKCNNCKLIKKQLDKNDIDYTEVDMSIGGDKDTIEMKKKFKSLGFKNYPIIVFDTIDGETLYFDDMSSEIIEGIIKDE